MAVEGLNAGKKLAVVAARDQDLGVRAYGGLKKRKRPRSELVFLKLGNLILARSTVSRSKYRQVRWHAIGRRTSTGRGACS